MKLIRHVFDNVRDSAIKKLGLSSANQRLDSTLIVSNIRMRGRIALFSNTLSAFLRDQIIKIFQRIEGQIKRAGISSRPFSCFPIAVIEDQAEHFFRREKLERPSDL